MEALDAILDSFKTRFNLQFSALPLHYTRVTEKFDAIENYRIRDGF